MADRVDRVRLIQELSAEERSWQPDPHDWLKEQDAIAADKAKVGGQDRARINLNEDDEVRNWCKSLGVDEETLRKAVAAVGDQVDAVRKHLGKR